MSESLSHSCTDGAQKLSLVENKEKNTETKNDLISEKASVSIAANEKMYFASSNAKYSDLQERLALLKNLEGGVAHQRLQI